MSTQTASHKERRTGHYLGERLIGDVWTYFGWRVFKTELKSILCLSLIEQIFNPLLSCFDFRPQNNLIFYFSQTTVYHIQTCITVLALDPVITCLIFLLESEPFRIEAMAYSFVYTHLVQFNWHAITICWRI